jgi:voltage-gated sodium channel
MTVRERVTRLVEAPLFTQAIMAVIVVNAITLGAQTVPAAVRAFDGLLYVLDSIALGIFVVELLLKLYAYRLKFFREAWNCFDFVVIAVSLVPGAGAFSILRALRVLRILRLVSMVPSMRRVVDTLLAAVPGAASIVGLLVIFVYVSAVMATTLFREASPQYFGGLGKSLWTLFQTLTGEAWPDIARDVMEEEPAAWIFFLIYILVSTFVVLNLFLAVLVNAMESVQAKEWAVERQTESNILSELAALRTELAALRSLLDPRVNPQGQDEVMPERT